MRVRLINEWKKCYKMWSVWFFILIATSPEIYQGFVFLGLLTDIPNFVDYSIRVLAGLGIASRVIQQKGLKDDVINKEVS